MNKMFATMKLLLLRQREEQAGDDMCVFHCKEAFVAAKDGGMEQQTSIFEPIIDPFSKSYKSMFFRHYVGSNFERWRLSPRVSPLLEALFHF